MYVKKESEIIRKNCVRGSIPMISDVIITDIHDKGHIPYFDFFCKSY